MDPLGVATVGAGTGLSAGPSRLDRCQTIDTGHDGFITLAIHEPLSGGTT